MKVIPEDFPLSDNFHFYEFVLTSQPGLRDQNKIEGLNFVNYLKATAQLMEFVRKCLGVPINVHSVFRCEAVNGGTPGSAKTSQHLLGQACDFTPEGFDGTALHLDYMFHVILEFLRKEKITFGQLIKEEANRGYSVSRWIHLSLGAPYRDIEKCGEVMAMEAGSDGVPHYELIEKLPQETK